MDIKEIVEELLQIRCIVKYIVLPAPTKAKQEGSLEQMVRKEKIPQLDNLDFIQKAVLELEQTQKKSFSVSVERPSQSTQKVNVTYRETEESQEIHVQTSKYSISISQLKEKPDEKPYTLSIHYENTEIERLHVSYALREYPKERDEALQDHTHKIDKTLHIMPTSLMGGVLGYTYLGENFMARRDDLVGDMARMVDVHEAIHTPDEYETRVLTSWMLQRTQLKYKQ
ncbi:MAG TPA: hypothetical protein VJH97_07465 [Candidatus Nanoarchaeia archaeon]|nr:hypothetical protein [Candidatus Nanoarchaeia archaeon]